FSSSESSSMGQNAYSVNSFDDFLSPPSSISSSNSNFSGYMNSGSMCGTDQQQQQQPPTVPAMSGGSSTQRQASVGGNCQPLSSTPASASMANASSFYLHTP